MNPGQRRGLRGYCPMGCGKTLFVGDGGHITCSWHSCPDPGALDAILGEDQPDHIVTFGLSTFTVRHPLRERVDRDGFCMEDCGLHGWIAKLDGPPVEPGRYVARLDDVGRWQFEEVEAHA
jgi:hypothetical protein